MKLLYQGNRPFRGFEEDAGFDLCPMNDLAIPPYGTVVVDTGTSLRMEDFPEWALPCFIIKGRSSMSIRRGIEVGTGGVIDHGYTGTIKVKLINLNNHVVDIKRTDRICQVIPFLVPRITKLVPGEMPVTERGDRGIGSSGE